MPLDLGLDIAFGLDACAFAEDRLGFRPDPWQARLLRSEARQVVLNCSRQAGKSTATAALALHVAIYDAGALVLLVSPSQRQSRELFGKVMTFLRSLEPAETLEEDNKLSATLANGSRIVSLPGDPKTVRGFSAPSLIVEDESGYVDDALYTAIRPMLAVSGGRLILMSTPNGRRGHFFETWTNAEGWERIKIVGREVPRISAEFLEQERRELGPMLFSQEYDGEFIDAQSSAFSSEIIEMALVSDFERFV
jgi:Terminase large subunit, T4likevirus-type, N-terminal